MIDKISIKDSKLLFFDKNNNPIFLNTNNISSLQLIDFFSLLLNDDLINKEKNIILPSYKIWIEYLKYKEKKISLNKFIVKNTNSLLFLMSYFKYEVYIYEIFKYKFFFKNIDEIEYNELIKIKNIFVNLDDNIIKNIFKNKKYFIDYSNKKLYKEDKLLLFLNKTKIKNDFQIEKEIKDNNLICLSINDLKDNEEFIEITNKENFISYKNKKNIHININKIDYDFLNYLFSILNIENNLNNYIKQDVFFDKDKYNKKDLTIKGVKELSLFSNDNKLIKLNNETFPFVFDISMKEYLNNNFIFFNISKEKKELFIASYIKEIVQNNIKIEIREFSELNYNKDIKQNIYINDYYDFKLLISSKV